MAKCKSCLSETSKVIKLKCPKCKTEIFRCYKCRALSIEYKCKCGFIGP